MAEASTSLLATKLLVPPTRPRLVSRPRLMERMQSALDYGLVLVSAPAGSGKTTLVGEWTRHIRRTTPVVWVSLDESDNDPIRFWDYVIAALRTIDSPVSEATPALLHSSQPGPMRSIPTALINDLARANNDFVLVLDDYHLIQSQDVHEGVSFLIDHLPPRMHLVIATRAEPPFPLAGWRGRQIVLEIGGDDLRFSVAEATTLFKDTHGLHLAPEDVSALTNRTEGWAVGLNLAALSMSRLSDTHAFVARFTGSQRYVTEYLMDEVLRRQSDDVRHFLLMTSVLDRLTGPLCDRVTACTGSSRLLQQLEHANLFLVPLDEYGSWYRYHRLFAELLRQQLQTTFASQEISLLHKTASEWYGDNGFPDESIHHSLAAGDWKRAVGSIYAQCASRIMRGEWRTLLAWLQKVPEEVLRTNIPLYCRYASVLAIHGDIETAEAAVGYLVEAAQSNPGLRGEVALLQADLAYRRGDFTHVIESCQEALAALPNASLDMRARASMLLGMARFYEGLFEEARSAATDAYEWGRAAGDRWVASTSLVYLGLVLRVRGELHRAAEIDRQAVALAGNSPAAASPQVGLAHILYEWNDLDGATLSAQSAVELGEVGGAPGARHAAFFDLAYVCLARGDTGGALAMMDKADETARHPMMTPTLLANHMAQRALFELRRNNLDSALAWASRLSLSGTEPGILFVHVPARVLIAQGRKTAALEQLAALSDRLTRQGARGTIVALRVCQALAADSVAQAMTFLSEALVIGEPEGYVRTFVDEGTLLTPLLREARAGGIAPGYTSRLLEIIETEQRQRRARLAGAGPARSVPTVLSARELQVLRLLSEDLSNQDIAIKLMISLNTTKTHVRHIFDKLDAKDRLQAVTTARDLKLI